MLAYRRTWLIKVGCMQQALEMIQQAVDLFRERRLTGRAYSSRTSPQDVIVWEEDWPSAQEHEEFWSAFRDTVEAKEWFEGWYRLVERGGTHEIWNLRA